MAENEKKVGAIYVSWLTFKNSIEELASSEVPNIIDRTVFTGMSWNVQNQLFTGLRFLNLVDDKNKPTPELAALAVPDEETRKAKLREILQKSYSDLFTLNLKKTTPGELAAKMGESYAVSGDTREKAVRFFTSAAEYLGIELSPLFGGKKTGSNNGSTSTRPRKRNSRKQADIGGASAAPNGSSGAPAGTSKSVTLASGGALTLSATLDLFSLNPADRKFVFELIDKLEEYEKANPKAEG